MYDAETGQHIRMEGEIIDPEPYRYETEDGCYCWIYPEDDKWDMRDKYESLCLHEEY